MSKRIEAKQKAREDKRQAQIKSGHMTYIPYKDRIKKESLPNKKSGLPTAAEEMAQRQEVIEKSTIVYRKMLPTLLQNLSKIDDPRNPNKVKHKITTLFAYGILLFVYQVGTRRNANRTMTTPILRENMNAMFPELESLPHADTLARFLEKIEVEKIQECLIELLKDLIRRKKFKNQFPSKSYLIAVDGSQKFYRDYEWDKRALQRHVGEERNPQYYAYVLETVIIFDNGMSLPLLAEILENMDHDEQDTKQDCESKAFIRLAGKLHKIFGKNRVTIVADGLYACGPVIGLCQKYKWGFMITLKEGSLPNVWREAIGLMRLEPSNSLAVQWGDREQQYSWANSIEYEYNNRTRCAYLNVVVCRESWIENHSRTTGVVEEKCAQYAWISSAPLSDKNVFKRCTKMARYRWKIESGFLVEKHEGYNFEHCYSYNWQAMKGFHYLMKIGHFLNTMAVHSEILLEYVRVRGIRGFIADMFLALSGALLDAERIRNVVVSKHLWRLCVT